jgi:hypothetical protein
MTANKLTRSIDERTGTRISTLETTTETRVTLETAPSETVRLGLCRFFFIDREQKEG